jgi:hypothetical protein
VTEQGPTFFVGLLILAFCVAPALLLDSDPWKQVAIANAVTHFVTGFAWTMVGTRFTRSIKSLALVVWSLTQFVALALLVAAIFVD